MGKRLCLGFVYLWDETWLGGVYYAQNLLKALNTLPDEEKPVVHLYCLNDKAFYSLQCHTAYPYMEKTLIKFFLIKRALRKIVSFISTSMADKINIINIKASDDVIFPYSFGSNKKKIVYWCPDFQEKHMPHFFPKDVVRDRDKVIRDCCSKGISLLFSSFDTQNDFFTFYPEYSKNPSFVVHFAVNIEDFSDMNIDSIKLKYGIRKQYLFCANQFWQHKNHLFLFKAFKKSIEQGLNMQLVCTGKLDDLRAPDYIKNVKEYVTFNKLEQDIRILGIIEKKELLCLMKESYAVIQPSLFEGWNTTVEDCKAMGKFIFLSNLRVHKEQINKNVCFFNPNDENDLVNKLLSVTPVEEYYDYSKNIKQFGEDFYQIIKSKKQS